MKTVKRDPFCDFLDSVDRWLWKAGFDADEIADFIAEHYNKLEKLYAKGLDAEAAINEL